MCVLYIMFWFIELIHGKNRGKDIYSIFSEVEDWQYIFKKKQDFICLGHYGIRFNMRPSIQQKVE